jgi:uncharacterized membrane protein (UPF0127 family)
MYVEKRTIIGAFIIMCVFCVALVSFIISKFVQKPVTRDTQVSSAEPSIIITPNPWDGYETTTRELEGKNVTLLVADNLQKQKRGLMFIRELPGFEGMVFTFDGTPAERSFWNKNTFVNLRLYWINNGEIIGSDSLPSIELSKEIIAVTSPGPVTEVVELIQ